MTTETVAEEMSIAAFVENYSVELATTQEVPLLAKVQWRLRNLLPSREKTVSPPYPIISVSSWRPEGENYVNFGDELACVIVDLMLARKGATLLDAVPRARPLLTVGSALHRGDDDTVVWGTGLHGASLAHDHKYRSLDVRAVRGPLTAKFLNKRGIVVPEIYGDPALLLPRLDGGRFQKRSRYEIGIVPNLHDMSFIKASSFESRYPMIKIIDPRRAWNLVIQDILDLQFVLASSLHGLVIADAYGIPNRYVRLTEREDILKYHDYYLGTGRILAISWSIEEARASDPALAICFDADKLMESFPYDLWASNS